MLFLFNAVFPQGKNKKASDNQLNKNIILQIYTLNLHEDMYKPDSMQEIQYTSLWDSIISATTKYFYDKNGNLIMINYGPEYREEFSYNEKNLMIEYRIYYREGDNGYADTILPVYKYTYDYNEQNRLTRRCLFGWYFDTKDWRTDTSSSEEYIYNSNGQLIRMNNFGFPLNNKSSTNITEYTYYKDSNFLAAVEKQDYLIEGQWQNEDSIIYRLNEDSLCILLEESRYNQVDSFWYRQNLEEFSYNENGKINCDVLSYFSQNTFIPWTKYYFTYDKYDQLTYITGYGWDADRQKWNHRNSYKYYYSDQNKISYPKIQADIKSKQVLVKK
jgi:hypothetical protein